MEEAGSSSLVRLILAVAVQRPPLVDLRDSPCDADLLDGTETAALQSAVEGRALHKLRDAGPQHRLLAYEVRILEGAPKTPEFVVPPGARDTV